MSVDHQLALVAEQQYGLLTFHQALGADISVRELQRRYGSGHLQRVKPGVYRIGGAPQSWRQQLMAAVLAAGPGAVASHRAAAVLWELDGVRDARPEVAVGRPDWNPISGVIVHRSTDIDRSVVTARFGIPVTSVARTVLDLGAVLKPWVVERAFNDALRRGLVTLATFQHELDAVARRGRRGSGVLRALVAARGEVVGQPESVLEDTLLRICRDHGLPMPICQYEITAGGRFVGRVDFAYPDARVVVEVDGWATHGSPAALQRDLARQNELVTAGWTVLRFTWTDVTQAPERVAATIRRALRAAQLP